jgi:hypothetical protein
MRRDKQVEKLIAQVQYRSATSIRERIRRHLDDRWSARPDAHPQHTGRGGTLTRWYKPAFAALALLALAGLIGLLGKSTGPAYALEQTVEAVKDIRYFHFQLRTNASEPEREAWIEYDPNRVTPRVRVNYYNLRTAATWDGGISQYWWQDTRELCIFDDQEYTDKILHFVRRYDPRQAITYLQERARQQDIQIAIHQPDKGAEPITVTVTYGPNTFLVGSPKKPMREQFYIDPVTKLITRVEIEGLVEGRYVRAGTWDYVDYNRPFEPRIFDLRQEVPPDVNVSDTTGIPMGLAQGQLSDEEIAVKVVREFLESWAAQDYGRAAQIHGYTALGEATSIREKLLRRKSILRVISVGPPIAAEPPLTGLLVPCEVKYEENGQTRTGPLEFRTNEGSPGRWRLRGPQQTK